MKNQTSLKETGSFINYCMGSNNSVPVVGEGATMLLHSDRHAYEVISVSKDGKRAKLMRYNAKRVDNNGMAENQNYEYNELCGYETEIVYKFGSWREVIRKVEFIDGITDNMTRAEIEACFDADANLQLVPGITKIRTTSQKINILFGVKQEYYDYSF